jgi:formylglycine-generating enzyme required for sulfatase activity
LGTDAPATKRAGPLPDTFTNRFGIEFIRIPRGRCWIGGGGGKPGDREETIPDDFYLGKYELTQEEWQKVMGNNPSIIQNVPGVSAQEQKRFPVDNVSWDDTQQFLRKLNAMDREPGWVYRLPRDVEWEYACRGGPMADRSESVFHYYFAKPTNRLLETQANFVPSRAKKPKRTCKVGSYEPNRLGLHDMHGNVWEWCDDTAISSKGEPRRVRRGGSWYSGADRCEARTRLVRHLSNAGADIGLRVARAPVVASK